MKQLIEDLISALEYHVEQTRPIYSTTVALQAAREALKSLPPQRIWVGLTDEHKEGLIYMTDPNPEPHHLRELIDVVEYELRSKNT